MQQIMVHPPLWVGLEWGATVDPHGGYIVGERQHPIRHRGLRKRMLRAIRRAERAGLGMGPDVWLVTPRGGRIYKGK